MILELSWLFVPYHSIGDMTQARFYRYSQGIEFFWYLIEKSGGRRWWTQISQIYSIFPRIHLTQVSKYWMHYQLGTLTHPSLVRCICSLYAPLWLKHNGTKASCGFFVHDWLTRFSPASKSPNSPIFLFLHGSCSIPPCCSTIQAEICGELDETGTPGRFFEGVRWWGYPSARYLGTSASL